MQIAFFYCVSNASYSHYRFSFSIFLDLPQFTQEPESTTVDIEKKVILTCRAVAKETPRITWFKVDQSGTLTQVLSVNVLANGDMQIEKTQRSDRSNYVCRACNAAGCKQTSKAMLNVLCKYKEKHGRLRYIIPGVKS